MKKGKLIVIEGISGSGQQVKAGIVALHSTLVENKYDVVECANPDSGRAKELGIANLLNWPFGRTPRADFLFESAVRTEVFKNVVEPALEQDKIVLCKQSSISSLANAWVSGYTKHFDVLRHIDKISRGFLFEDEIYPESDHLHRRTGPGGLRAGRGRPSNPPRRGYRLLQSDARVLSQGDFPVARGQNRRLRRQAS